jgi:hypothetical protein
MKDNAVSFVAEEGRSEFDSTRAARDAIENPTRTQFDIVAGYQLVGTSLPRIIPFRAQLVALTGFDGSLIDRVSEYGRAAMYALKRERANGLEKSVTHPKLVEELEQAYFRFYKTAEYLVAMGLMNKQILAAARTGTSVVDRSTDLGTLALEFDAHRARLGTNVILTADEIARAAKLSREVVDSLVQRSNAESAPSEFRSDRQRAAMVFFDAWEEIRRAVHWLRWYEGDATTLAPSLFTAADRRARDDGSDGTDGEDEGTGGVGGGAGGGAGGDGARKPVEPVDPMPADKREELARGGEAGTKRVPQDDPFIR